VSTPNTDRPEPPAARGRVVIHASCSVHQGARGFTNLVIRKLNGEIELDPHVDGSCKLALVEDEACTLRADRMARVKRLKWARTSGTSGMSTAREN
jgi:hypothetical protein